MDPSSGYEWVVDDSDIFKSIAIRFTREPTLLGLRIVAQNALGLPETEDCRVDFWRQGLYNKVYRVTCSKGDFVIRVSLPIESPSKIESEIATMDFARQQLLAPVPDILAYDAKFDNPIGFPFIVMRFIPGGSLTPERWLDLLQQKKETLVLRLAHIYARAFRHRFECFGSLYRCPDHGDKQKLIDQAGYRQEVVVGRYMGTETLHADEPYSRDPCPSSYEWLEGRIAQIRRNLTTLFPSDQLSQASKQLDLIHSNGLAYLFSRNSEGGKPIKCAESTFLDIHDVHLGNLMVDEQGELQAIIDWDFTTVVPDWLACNIPTFLRVHKVAFTPDEAFRQRVGEELYSSTLYEYEITTIYQPMFLAEMKRLEPNWVEIYIKSDKRKQLVDLVASLENGQLLTGMEEYWLEEQIQWPDVFDEDEE